MRRVFRPLVLVLAFTALAPIAAENGRDLGKASPESVGVSADRLKRLDAGMQRFIDEGRLASSIAVVSTMRSATCHATWFIRR
ncbi:MAG TPA: hypothetical protein VNJ02_15145 [Vicinamibacterales bacterium]|nr:hypothetical protein [Vicinamibacterales bacterium]